MVRRLTLEKIALLLPKTSEVFVTVYPTRYIFKFNTREIPEIFSKSKVRYLSNPVYEHKSKSLQVYIDNSVLADEALRYSELFKDNLVSKPYF